MRDVHILILPLFVPTRSTRHWPWTSPDPAGPILTTQPHPIVSPFELCLWVFPWQLSQCLPGNRLYPLTEKGVGRGKMLGERVGRGILGMRLLRSRVRGRRAREVDPAITLIKLKHFNLNPPCCTLNTCHHSKDPPGKPISGILLRLLIQDYRSIDI